LDIIESITHISREVLRIHKTFLKIKLREEKSLNEEINRLVNVDQNEIYELKHNISKDKIHMVELDGKCIHSWIDYISEMQTKFKFPTSCMDSFDRYLDWITDLHWLGDKEQFILIIHNYNEFIKDDPLMKKNIITTLEDHVLPFWEVEVEHVVVGGRRKSFMVYLVE
jgi:hypothetical protein